MIPLVKVKPISNDLRKQEMYIKREDNDPPERRSQGSTSPGSYDLLKSPGINHRQRSTSTISGARTTVAVDTLSFLGTHEQDLKWSVTGC